MRRSKLIELLEKLDGYQWRSLEAFVNSPFHNTNPDVVALFNHLHSAWQVGFQEKALSRRAVHTSIFPDTPFQCQAFNQLMSRLLKLAEKWLAWQRLEKDEALLESLKAEELLKLKLEKHYQQASRAAERQMEKSPMKSEHYYYRYKISELKEKHFAGRNLRRADPSLQNASDSLDDHFALQKLRYLCEMLNRQKLIPQPFHFTFAQAIEEHLRESALEEKPLLAVYFQLYRMLSGKEGTSKNFDRYIALFRQHSRQIGREEARGLLYYAINFCIGKVREGERDFATRLFGLYQQGMEEEILMEGGTISPWTYKNMVKLGLNLKRYEWAEQFAKDYARYLPEAEKQDALHYNLAEIYFFQGEYEKALSQLRQVEFSDIHYNLGSKALLAKIYYEQGQWDVLESLLSAFRVFLRRNRSASVEVKEPYVNFVKLLSATLRRLPESYGSLIQKVKEAKAINNRDWLLRQLES